MPNLDNDEDGATERCGDEPRRPAVQGAVAAETRENDDGGNGKGATTLDVSTR